MRHAALLVLLMLPPLSGPAAGSLAELDVRTIRPQSTEIASPIHATGNILPLKTSDLAPSVAGIVETVHVGVGDRVTAGDPLLTIRQDEILLKKARSEQAVRLADAELANAKRELESARDLSQRQLLARDELENLETMVEVAEAKASIAAIDLEDVKRQLAETVITAPFDGVITERNVDEGAYFSTMRGMGSGAALQLQQINIVVASVFVPEKHLRDISVGTRARVEIPSIGREIESVVHVINDRIDLQTRSIDVRIGIENQDYRIKTGLFCHVELLPPGRTALTLPRSAVLSGPGHYVMTVDGGTATRTTVEVRELPSGEVEILSGLSPDARVLTGPGLRDIKPGTTVSDVTAPTTAASD